VTGNTAIAPVAPLLLNTRETAATLSISPRKLWSLTNRNDIPHVRIGRRVLYDPRDLRLWIDKQKGDTCQ